MKPPSSGRAARLPLYVQVVTDPAVHDCFSVDISATGIGLIADRHREDGLPAEGQEIDLEFALPDSGSLVRAHGVIKWRHDAPGPVGAEIGVAMGLHFTWMPGPDRAALARYLNDYRFHVGVAFALGDERALVEEALGEVTRLHFADSVGTLREVTERGDVAAVVACGNDAALLSAVVSQTHGALAGETFPGPSAPRDFAPRVIYLGLVPPETLIASFNDGRIFRALSPPVAPAELRHAVLQACGDYGVRTEQHRLAQALERALLQERARKRPEAQLRGVVARRMAHQSPAMEQVVRLARTVAPHRVVVLLQGETGTGKEILAQTIHELSDRANASFVVQDCGALPENLLESELFGHVKGAFTGATGDHPGIFRLAEGGTVFLDEIENTTPSVQARLLRVLETGTVRPVGGTQVRHVDVRIVAASNRDLREEVAAGHLRADLFYRLSTFIIDIPPLRSRSEDILILARHFLDEANLELGCRATGLSPETEACLLAYRWPGNVRELRNVIERAVLLSMPGEAIAPEHLPPDLVSNGGTPPSPERGQSLRDRVAATERTAIQDALDRHHGVIRRAAVELGVSPVTLGRKIRQLGLDPKGR